MEYRSTQKEFVADFIGDTLFTDENFIAKLSEKPTLFSKVYDEIKYLAKSSKGTEAEKQLLDLQRKFEKMYREADANKESGTKYSVSSGMTSAERYNELKNKKIKLATAKNNQLLNNYDLQGKRINDIYKFVRDNKEKLGLDKTYQKDDIQLSFGYSNRDIKKSIMQTSDNKIDLREYLDVLSCLDEVIDSAVLVESHSNKKESVINNIKQVYVLMGAYRKGTEMTPVQLEIKEQINDSNHLYLAVTIKKSEVNDTPSVTEVADAVSTPDSLDISIQELIDKVNSSSVGFLKYLPSEFLTKEQLEGKIKGMEEDVQKYPYSPFGQEILDAKKLLQNKFNTMHYSVSDTDNQGNKLTKNQQEYLKDSKVRDENGNLKVMYHGTPNGDFTVFRDGTYFTENKDYADVYQSQGASSLGYKTTANNPKTYEAYLNIKKPFDTRNPKERAIFENEYYGQWGMGTPLMESGLPDWLDGEDLREFLQEKGYDYDGLILDEGGVGGYGDEVKSRGLSYEIR